MAPRKTVSVATIPAASPTTSATRVGSSKRNCSTSAVTACVRAAVPDMARTARRVSVRRENGS
jgi:hypothetical protein